MDVAVTSNDGWRCGRRAELLVLNWWFLLLYTKILNAVLHCTLYALTAALDCFFLARDDNWKNWCILGMID